MAGGMHQVQNLSMQQVLAPQLQQSLQILQAPMLELRNLVATVAPEATEEIKRGGFVYYFGKLGGPVSAGICGIKIRSDHIQLNFPHGAFIEDPKSLLRGTGKAMRYVRLYHYNDIPWDDIKRLIEEHANFDPRSYSIS